MSSSLDYEPGAPVEGVIPLSVPVIRGSEWAYVKECLDTGWVSSVGKYVDHFEESVRDFVGAKYAVAVVNGTEALHMALLVAGVQPDDEVLVSTLTFIAPANAIRYTGAYPIFIDAEPDYWQFDVQKAADFLEHECSLQNGELRNKSTGRRVRAILPVHILGHPVDMNPLLELAKRYQLMVIEDATEALGSKYNGRMVGTLGHIACFSFNGNKIITTGGGGMIVTDNQAFAKRAKYLTTQAKDDSLEYIHHEVGYNYRLTNIQGAMGVAQMEQLPDYIECKNHITARYNEAFKEVSGITLMPEAEWAESNHWLYTILIDEVAYGIDSRTLLRKLADAKIQTRPLWQPLHLSKAHHDAPERDNPVAERLCRMSLSLPCSVNLTSEQQDYVISKIIEFQEPPD